MRILFIGDVYMEQGRKALVKYFETVKTNTKPNIIILNAENIADGHGITQEIYKQLMGMGINVLTLGNHAYTRRDCASVLELPNIARPANYGIGAKGKEYITLNYNGKTITIINLLGRVFMRDQIDNPFTKMDQLLEMVKSDYYIVDFHAEATSEKYAMANYLDGRVNALLGTHTHVPTADACVFPKGMLYISDVGMTGIKYGIIGGEIQQGIRKFLTGVPERVIPETTGLLQFNAVILDLDQKKIETINIFE
ncbi:MAG: TIGR00282 family metallophosphoesterase [Candidatus Izemoplasmatales bacterium]|nr:TIGR00282 family metallophosphoesterase [Candidatus Izemoplasmatales bacterium]MDD3864743.1 TIGR00282 family metallophosphoesterase [Candidatus Izemoplasmatales bacterium]